jgi:hypothetical protein
MKVSQTHDLGAVTEKALPSWVKNVRDIVIARVEPHNELSCTARSEQIGIQLATHTGYRTFAR